MDELIDILDEQGNYTGKTAMKSKAHQLGLFHPTTHVWCYSQRGMVLLQQRGAHKSTYPLKWDVSVAGHLGAGESPELGALREVQEEIGVAIEMLGLEKIGVFQIEKKHSKRMWDREFTHTFLYRMDSDIMLVPQVSEVEALEWVSLKDFEGMVSIGDERFVPNSTERYRKVITEIESRL